MESFSLLICSNRWSGTFQKLLESILKQSLKPCDEIIVVDNGISPDGIKNIQESLSKTIARFILLNEPTPGQGHARKTGLQACRCDWVVFLDDDNYLVDGFLDELRSFTQAHPDVGGICPRVIAEWEKPVPDWKHDFGRRYCLSVTESGKYRPDFGESIWDPADGPAGLRPPGGGMIIRSKVGQAFLSELSNRPEAFALERTGSGLGGCQDAIIYSFVYSQGYSAAYVPSLAVYHQLPSSRAEFAYLFRLNYQMMLSYGAYHRLLLFPDKNTIRLKAWISSLRWTLLLPPYGVKPLFLKIVRSIGYFLGLFDRQANRNLLKKI